MHRPGDDYRTTMPQAGRPELALSRRGDRLPVCGVPQRAVFALLFLVALLMPGPASALEKVSLQLKWLHQFQFAGYYVALEKGFYRDAGFDVEIRSGGPNIDATV